MATAYLEKSRWDIQQALRTYFNQQQSLPRTKRPSKLLVALYDKYKDPEQPETILIDGTLAYLEDLGFDPEDLVSLTLAYVLRSPQTGEFSRQSFLDVWGDLEISTIAEMRKYILERHKALRAEPKEYEKLYQYVFDFIRGSDTRIKTIGHEEAVMYWKLLLADIHQGQDRLEQWYEFITTSERSISKDVWNMFFKFVIQVIVADPTDLSGYDEMSAWPSVVDEYMEWLQAKGYMDVYEMSGM